VSVEIRVYGRRGFRKAVALFDWDSRQYPKLPGHLRRQRSGTAVHVAHRREVAILDMRQMNERKEHLGSAHGDGLRHQHVHPVNVKKREVIEKGVRLCDGHGILVLELDEIRGQVPVTQHDSLRNTRGPAGIGDHCKLIWSYTWERDGPPRGGIEMRKKA